MDNTYEVKKSIKIAPKLSWASHDSHFELDFTDSSTQLRKQLSLNDEKLCSYVMVMNEQHLHMVWIPSLKALTRKLTSGMPKMPKSHDQPLCAYLMRYDAHIQSHQRSWPKWHGNQISLKSKENNWSYRLDTKHSWPSTQVHYEKRKNLGKNTNIEIQQNTGLISYVPISYHTIPSLKALAAKIDFWICLSHMTSHYAHI